jgi:hypothetical protein
VRAVLRRRAYPRQRLPGNKSLTEDISRFIAVDFVVPDRPGWITGLLAYGAVINPLLFLPLAFEGRGLNSVPRQAAMFSSFGALSIGFTALAIYALA